MLKVCKLFDSNICLLKGKDNFSQCFYLLKYQETPYLKKEDIKKSTDVLESKELEFKGAARRAKSKVSPNMSE